MTFFSILGAPYLSIKRNSVELPICQCETTVRYITFIIIELKVAKNWKCEKIFLKSKTSKLNSNNIYDNLIFMGFYTWKVIFFKIVKNNVHYLFILIKLREALKKKNNETYGNFHMFPPPQQMENHNNFFIV